MKDTNRRRGSRLRIAAWCAAAFILLLPLIVMLFTGELNWTVGDFVFAGILLFGPLGAYELAVRMTGNTAYRAGAGVALLAVFLLVWINAAVGITDGDADGMYLGVLAVGIVGALIARFQPEGMVYAMSAMALATASVAAIALAAGLVPAYNSAFEILGLNVFFVVLFAGSALLFRQAAQGQSTASAKLQG